MAAGAAGGGRAREGAARRDDGGKSGGLLGDGLCVTRELSVGGRDGYRNSPREPEYCSVLAAIWTHRAAMKGSYVVFVPREG